MTFITVVPPSIISRIRANQCSTLSKSETLNYDLGKNTKDELFIRITDYTGGGSYPRDWFAIHDLVQSFSLANGKQVSTFEPFDGNSLPQSSMTNTNISGFLKAILLDTIC